MAEVERYEQALFHLRELADGGNILYFFTCIQEFARVLVTFISFIPCIHEYIIIVFVEIVAGIVNDI